MYLPVREPFCAAWRTKARTPVEGGTDVAAFVIGRNHHAAAGNPCQTCIPPWDQVAAPDIEVAGDRRGHLRPLPLETEAGVRVAQKPLVSGTSALVEPSATKVLQEIL